MRHLRALIAMAVLLNAALLAFLLLRPAEEAPLRKEGPASLPAVTADPTMAATRYDLSARREQLNVIVISMDALRWDHTGLDGGEGSQTPNLDRFADESVVFHNAVSAASWTLPSHMSMWTARWPTVHGVTNKLKLLAADQMVETTLSAGIETFPESLIRQGWKGVGFTGGAGVQGKYGYSRGFSSWLDDKPFAGLDHSMPPALQWLSSPAAQSGRFLLFLHGYDSHGQYPLPQSELASIPNEGQLKGTIEENAELREAGLASIQQPGQAAELRDRLSAADSEFLRRVYARKVKDADQRLGQFLDHLRSSGLLDRSIVAIVSDHGDEYMERSSIDHGHTLYEEQLHVVMMLRFPGGNQRQDVRELVRTIDLFPTLFGALGLQGPSGVNGQSLLPLLRGQPYETQVYSETDYRLFVHHRMMRDGKYKLILDLLDGKKELYDVEADPGELKDLSSTEPRRTYEMEQKLRKWMEQMGSNPHDYLGVRQKPITIF